ncbi:putative transcription factor C2H2 family [Helianthus debilis subsp. tardiflorus]
MEKVRIQIEEMQRRNSMRLTAAYELINKRLKTKEDEIHKIVEINQSLEEKVKSMTIENQIWRELAQTNEATANALRNNLQQVLAEIHFQQQEENHLRTNGNDEDAQSQCGSNQEDDSGGERKYDNNEVEWYNKNRRGRWCRKCGKEESSVLLVPCRHLCVCRLCVSNVDNCPVCNCVKSAGVQVNMG